LYQNLRGRVRSLVRNLFRNLIECDLTLH
jgi:hypothetical protein